jgi:hypothetical protein
LPKSRNATFHSHTHTHTKPKKKKKKKKGKGIRNYPLCPLSETFSPSFFFFLSVIKSFSFKLEKCNPNPEEFVFQLRRLVMRMTACMEAIERPYTVPGNAPANRLQMWFEIRLYELVT